MRITRRHLRKLIREEKQKAEEGKSASTTKRQLRRIIREAARVPMDGGRYKPNPQFPKMTYPEDRAKARDPAVALEKIVKAIQHARSLGVSEADIVDAVRSEVGTMPVSYTHLRAHET